MSKSNTSWAPKPPVFFIVSYAFKYMFKLKRSVYNFIVHKIVDKMMRRRRITYSFFRDE